MKKQNRNIRSQELSKDVWQKAYILLYHNRKTLNRYKLAKILNITETLARYLIFAFDNRKIINFEPEKYSVDKKQTVLWMSDLHIPFENKINVETVLEYGKELKPDKIILGGDIIDFYKISRFLKDPKKKNINFEINKVKEFLTKLRNSFPDSEIIYIEGNHECVEENTEILTINGWKKAKEITYNDKIANFDLNTKEIFFNQANKISKFIVTNLIEYETYLGHEIITKNHKIVINGERISILKALSNKLNQKNQYFAGYLKNKRVIKLSNDWIKFITWVIMDGCLYKITENKIRIQWKLSKQDKIDNLIHLLNKMNIKYTFKKATKSGVNKKQPYMIRIYGKTPQILYRYLKGIKQFPEWFKYLNSEQLNVLIETISKTDGYRHFNHISWITTNKHNADIIQLACIFNNIPCKITKLKNRSGFNSKKTQYRVDIYNNGISGKFADFKVKKGNFNVIAIDINNNTLITRVNGKINFTGNSRLELYIIQNAKELYHIMENFYQDKLKLSSLRIDYQKGAFRIGKLWFLHGHETRVRNYNVEYITNVMWKRIHDNFICGHWHRTQDKTWKSIGKKYYGGYAVGSLCQDLDYMPINNWNNGFAVIYFDNSGYYKVENKKIINGEIF